MCVRETPGPPVLSMPNHGGNLQRNHNEQSIKHSSYKKEIEIEKKRKKR